MFEVDITTPNALFRQPACLLIPVSTIGSTEEGRCCGVPKNMLGHVVHDLVGQHHIEKEDKLAVGQYYRS